MLLEGSIFSSRNLEVIAGIAALVPKQQLTSK